MLYIDIILNELKKIIFFDKYIFTFIFILFLILFYIVYRNFFSNGPVFKFITILRLLILLLLLPLINNSVFNKNIKSSRSQNVSFIIDNSKSMQYLDNNDSTYFNNIFKQISDWADNKKINLKWYTLDEQLNSYHSISYNRDNTSFSNVKNILKKNEADQIIIFSDGNINSDFVTTDLFIPNNIKVHTIGIGKINNNMDVGFQDVTINNMNDSTYLDVMFNIDIVEDANFKFKIYSNEDKIYVDSINVIKGQYFFEKTFKIKSEKLTDNITLDILTDSFNDINQHNNKWVVKNPHSKHLNLLIISSALSYNTMFIKSVISEIDDTHIEHIYKHNNNMKLNLLNVSDFDGIILDNFPNDQNDYNYLDKLFSKEKPYIFIEGYDLNPLYIVNFFNNRLKSNLYIEPNHLSKSLLLNNEMNLNGISSSFNIYLDSKNDFLESLHYDNKSIYQLRNNNFLGLFIPKLSEHSFYSKTKYDDTYFVDYIKYLFDTHFGQNRLYKLNLKKKNYLLGDKLKINIDNFLSSNKKNQKLIIKNLDTNIIDSINYLENSDIILSKEGNFEVWAYYLGTNNKEINSNKETYFVSNKSVELDQISQNQVFLSSISNRYNGFYTDIEKFSNSWLSNIQNEKISINVKKIYTALEIFIKEKIFILVLILFCFEIYLRKKTGLL